MFDDLFIECTNEEKKQAIELMKNNLSLLKQNIIPDSYPNFISSVDYILYIFENQETYLTRSFFTEFSWPLVSKDWINELLPLFKGKKVLEIMAGNGMISKALIDNNVDCITTDDFSWKIDKAWTYVENLSAIDAIEKYGNEVDILLCSWPPMSDSMYKCLLKMRNVNPNLVLIYIGELGDCCANEKFADKCIIINNPYIQNANKKFKSWGGIHDRIYYIK